jgi:hypothetical protein
MKGAMYYKNGKTRLRGRQKKQCANILIEVNNDFIIKKESKVRWFLFLPLSHAMFFVDFFVCQGRKTYYEWRRVNKIHYKIVSSRALHQSIDKNLNHFNQLLYSNMFSCLTELVTETNIIDRMDMDAYMCVWIHKSEKRER